MFKHFIYFIIAFGCIFIAQEASAVGMGLGMGMGMGPPGGPCGTPPWPPCVVPLDGGIGFLAAAGAYFGYKKLVQPNKKNPA